MEANKQTVILFRIRNTTFNYETLYEYLSDSKAVEILEAVEFDGFIKFPFSATDIIDEANRYLYENGYIDEENYYTERITPETTEVLQKVLDLIAKNHNNDNLLINERTIHVPIAILPEDIDYFNSNKEFSNRLKEWLSEVKKISQNLSR